ncbi:LysR family transcriptional regulator [Alkalihalobacterium bogoriense]|uniref:LysR family transcriptional regulator n=1 Tax=Alkalihalobacterium bogoriense TaxID=246272 RepID=UPI00047B91D8|nr:LysR family transcriptional regulator [Alkalihalobacterium bogoriense]
MEIRQLKYFIEVAKREHMTEAADVLHVAQSAVSRQISNLEAELGVSLFIRQGRKVRLTPIGRMFLDRTIQAMKMLDNATREVKEQLDPSRGTIRVSFPISLAAYIIPTAISAFREQYPEAKFQLKQATYHELIDLVLDGDYNMAILGPVPEHDERLYGHVLFTEKMVALVPINHHLAREPVLKLKQLKGESFILLPEKMKLREMITSACREQGFNPNVAFEGDDVDALKGLVSAGLGISVLPDSTVLENFPRATVKIPIVDPVVPRTVGIITAKDRKLLPTEELFFAFLKTFFSKWSASYS